MTGTTTDPLSLLRELHRAGRIAAEYPAVRRALRRLPPGDMARAGHLLARVDPDEVRRAHPGTPVLTVRVTGHGTLGPLIPPLAAELARHGLTARVAMSGFDSYVLDLSGPLDADLVLCVLDPAVVVDELPLPWGASDVESVAERVVARLDGLAATFGAAGTGTLVLNTLPLPRHVAAQLVDHGSRARLGAAWREANARLLRLVEAHPRTVVIDLDPLLAEGVPATDPRLDTYARVHLSPELLAAYAREVGHLARHVAGRTAKCLVLDLDGTVWGGVLGDDGADGIEVADGRRGGAFAAFQRVARQIGSQGVLLAVVSKNDHELVRDAFRAHPGMPLREADLVRIVANWRPKPENLAELARDLNLGADSLVLVDDSPHECELVRRQLPETAVVELDGEPALHVRALLEDGWFDTRDVTEEDRARGSRYREERSRQDFLARADSIQDYLRDLGLKVTLAVARDADVPRLSQLTLRTNQFNLTTRRLQPEDVRRLARDPSALVLTIRARDRFGDSGLVGAMLVRQAGAAMHIDDFLLSCRVFSRGIEQACLSAVLRYAHAAGADAVFGTYRPTARNAGVRDLYSRHGFAPAATEGGAATYRHNLVDIAAMPAHIALATDFGGGAP